MPFPSPPLPPLLPSLARQCPVGLGKEGEGSPRSAVRRRGGYGTHVGGGVGGLHLPLWLWLRNFDFVWEGKKMEGQQQDIVGFLSSPTPTELGGPLSIPCFFWMF